MPRLPGRLAVCLVTTILGACGGSGEPAWRFVSGTVQGLSGSVALTENGENAILVTSDGSFSFPQPLAEGTSYTIAIQRPPTDQTCTVSNGQGVVGARNITNVSVVCSSNAPPSPSTYTVGGAISGLTGTVVLTDNGGDTQSISTDGAFTFVTPIATGANYAVSVQTQPADQTCTVSNGAGTMGAANVTAVTVVCSTNTHTVGGAVSGLSGSVVVQDNGGDTLTINANGTFTFPTSVAQGSPYVVTVSTQPATQTCTVTNANGTMGGANVSNVNIVCSTNAYTVGGIVSGLVGTVVLQDNGTDNLSLNSDGSFTFATPVAEGSSYSVTVQTQPAAQTCTVTNGTGVIGATNITNVTATCVTNNTTLSVAATATIPVGSGTGTVTVTNTGTFAALNVYATLPGGWTGVTQDASNCTTVLPAATCTLTFTSTTPYVAQAGITVTGDNISSPPTMALAFTFQGYLVFAISGNTATVVDSSDIGTVQWGIDPQLIGASSLTDGAANTALIVASGMNPTAALSCYNSTSGGASVGTWYLPAVCQLGRGGSAGCAAGIANIDANLFQLGFGGMSGYYWSSTEWSVNPAAAAWIPDLVLGQVSAYVVSPKSNAQPARCVRDFSY